MDGLLLQDFTTIRSTSTFTQSATAWLDIGDYEDLTFYLDVKEFTGSSLTYQTSPTRQDGSFQSLIPAFGLAVGLRVDVISANVAPVPPARYVRWQLTGTGTFERYDRELWIDVDMKKVAYPSA